MEDKSPKGVASEKSKALAAALAQIEKTIWQGFSHALRRQPS